MREKIKKLFKEAGASRHSKLYDEAVKKLRKQGIKKSLATVRYWYSNTEKIPSEQAAKALFGALRQSIYNQIDFHTQSINAYSKGMRNHQDRLDECLTLLKNYSDE